MPAGHLLTHGLYPQEATIALCAHIITHSLTHLHVAEYARCPQFVQAGPLWLAAVLQALAPPFALFRALWEASQYAFMADASSRPTGKPAVMQMAIKLLSNNLEPCGSRLAALLGDMCDHALCRRADKPRFRMNTGRQWHARRLQTLHP